MVGRQKRILHLDICRYITCSFEIVTSGVGKKLAKSVSTEAKLEISFSSVLEESS